MSGRFAMINDNLKQKNNNFTVWVVYQSGANNARITLVPIGC